VSEAEVEPLCERERSGSSQAKSRPLPGGVCRRAASRSEPCRNASCAERILGRGPGETLSGFPCVSSLADCLTSLRLLLRAQSSRRRDPAFFAGRPHLVRHLRQQLLGLFQLGPRWALRPAAATTQSVPTHFQAGNSLVVHSLVTWPRLFLGGVPGTIMPHQVPQRLAGLAAYSWMVHISVSLTGSTTVLL